MAKKRQANNNKQLLIVAGAIGVLIIAVLFLSSSNGVSGNAVSGASITGMAIALGDDYDVNEALLICDSNIVFDKDECFSHVAARSGISHICTRVNDPVTKTNCLAQAN